MTADATWRVSWQRQAWAKWTSRSFPTEREAKEFIVEKLWGTDRPELTPLVFVRLERHPLTAARGAAA